MNSCSSVLIWSIPSVEDLSIVTVPEGDVSCNHALEGFALACEPWYAIFDHDKRGTRTAEIVAEGSEISPHVHYCDQIPWFEDGKAPAQSDEVEWSGEVAHKVVPQRWPIPGLVRGKNDMVLAEEQR